MNFTFLNNEKSKKNDSKGFYESSRNFNRSSFSKMQGLEKVLQPGANIKSSIPTLLIVGENDLEVAKDANTKWAQESNSKLVIIGNSGHCANYENNQAFHESLINFLNQY